MRSLQNFVRYVTRHDGSTDCVPRPGLGPCTGTVASVGELSHFLDVGMLNRGILRTSRDLAHHKLPGNSVPADRLRPVQGHTVAPVWELGNANMRELVAPLTLIVMLRDCQCQLLRALVDVATCLGSTAPRAWDAHRVCAR